MGKPNSTEELKVTRNIKWNIGKLDSDDYISMLRDNQLVMGKTKSTVVLKVTRNTMWTIRKLDSHDYINVLGRVSVGYG